MDGTVGVVKRGAALGYGPSVGKHGAGEVVGDRIMGALVEGCWGTKEKSYGNWVSVGLCAVVILLLCVCHASSLFAHLFDFSFSLCDSERSRVFCRSSVTAIVPQRKRNRV